MPRTTVGILRGGPSPEYDVSLKTGSALLNALPEDRYLVRDVFIDKRGEWHLHGKATEPARILQQLDAVLNGLHGTYGEDGTVQRILERSRVPFAGTRASASSLAMHKARTQAHLAQHGVRMPRTVHLSLAKVGTTPMGDLAQGVFQRFGPPYVVKPARLGSSVGVRIINSVHDLPQALADALSAFDHILVQEHIAGREATVGVIERFRGQDLYALPAVEIVPKRSFFDYEAKYAGASEERCPSTFDSATKLELEELAKHVHESMELAHYSRSDFIVHPSGRVYFLEVNTLPGLTEQSLMPLALSAVGSSLSEFAEHLVKLARDDS
ncbi:MAG TPA: D-alanine--D-alanine ligase [Candidatus Paceibacterota bacterium]|nr:D-alanine--D-alanine ligase [Candidatus Paceibacterota bacterium]